MKFTKAVSLIMMALFFLAGRSGVNSAPVPQLDVKLKKSFQADVNLFVPRRIGRK